MFFMCEEHNVHTSAFQFVFRQDAAVSLVKLSEKHGRNKCCPHYAVQYRWLRLSIVNSSVTVAGRVFVET